jgi:Leucine-rich repeat (LRR) protein
MFMEFLDGYEAIMTCKAPLKVKRVRISGYELDAALRNIKTFQNLESFECSWGGSWSHIPDAILKLPKLKHLSFQRNYLSEIPAEIIYAENLEVLDLSHNNIGIIPQEISNLKHLRELNLNKNPIYEIDEAILEMDSLKDLNIAKAIFSQLPEVLLKLIPQLTILVLSRKLTTQLQKKHPELVAQLPYLYQWTSLEKKYLKTLRQVFLKEDIEAEQQVFLLNLLSANDHKIQQQLNLTKLLKAANLKRMESIRLRALEYLGTQFNEASRLALEKNARVCVQGKIGINKNELRQKLKDHKISYTAKLDDKTTHYLVGQLPGEAVYEAEAAGIHIITEKNIIDYWEAVENPYLIETAEESPEQLEGMAAMLTSNQAESIGVALEMFKQGGFPKSLITELFIAYKCLMDHPSLQREAERLLRQYGSADLIAKLNMENALFSYKLGESTTTSYLNKYAKNTELDAIKMARIIFRLFGNAQLYLMRRLSEKEALAFIESELMKGGSLDLSRKSLKNIPPVVYKLGDKLKKLNLEGNSFDKLNDKIKVFTALEELDLRYNYNLRRMESRVRALVQVHLPHCKLLL